MLVLPIGLCIHLQSSKRNYSKQLTELAVTPETELKHKLSSLNSKDYHFNQLYLQKNNLMFRVNKVFKNNMETRSSLALGYRFNNEEEKLS